MSKVTEQDEQKWDKLLNIKTTGRDDTLADQYRYPYEPTPYAVLERLAYSGYIRKGNTLLDYGCGKGRVGLFLSWQTKCKSIGVEYDERMYAAACENQKQSGNSARSTFVLANAENFALPDLVDRVYFFNPFSPELLDTVLARVRESYYEKPRELLLFFYYPSDEYVSRLMTQDDLMFADEIDCQDLYTKKDAREKILIFEMI